MRALLLILTLTGLLAACSDNGDGQPDDTGVESAESAEMQDQGQSDPGESEEPDLEAGQPVNKPTTPDLESSDDSEQKDQDGSGDESGEAAEDTTKADQNKDDSGEKVAAAEIYDRYCVACHEQGMAGAPKLSNTAEWEKRIDERGVEGLVSNSWGGYRAMPAKGTCSDCSQEEIRATVEWMLNEGGVSF